MLIRSMSPSVVVADEIGNCGDAEAIRYAMCSGVKGIFTAHGNCIEDIKLNPEIGKLMEINIIERIIVLKNKKIENIYFLK